MRLKHPFFLVLGIASLGCASRAQDSTETSAEQPLSAYGETMRDACLRELGASVVSARPAMSTDAAVDLAHRTAGAELGRLRLRVRRAFCSTRGYAPWETPSCSVQDMPLDIDNASTAGDDRDYRAAKVFLDADGDNASLRLETTTAETSWFRPTWKASGTFDDLRVELLAPPGSPLNLRDDLVPVLGGSRLVIAGRMTDESLAVDKTIEPSVVWNTVQCWRIDGVMRLQP